MKKALKIYGVFLFISYALYGLSTSMRDMAWKQHVEAAKKRGEDVTELNTIHFTGVKPVLFLTIENFKQALGHLKEGCKR